MSRWTEAAARNRELVAENAERVLADTTYDRFRSPTALRVLVIATSAVIAGIPVAWLVGGSIIGVLVVIGWVALHLILRVAVRSQADLPDEVLDERMRAERDRVYLGAFRLLASVTFLAANAAFIAVAFGEDRTITFDYDSVSAVFWTLFALMISAPSLVLAVHKWPTGTR